MDVERWVDERIRSLDYGAQATPGGAQVLARLHARERNRRAVRRRLIRAGVAASLVGVGFAAVGTFRRFHTDVKPAAEIRRPAPEPLPIVEQPKLLTQVLLPPANGRPDPPAPAPASPVLNANFKEIGSPDAPIGCEIYTDYECPPCASFYRNTVPLLIAQYVNGGRVRLLRRDFPLKQHGHAQLAARYADAAGLIGQFQVVTDRIFLTQTEWHQDGDIDRQIAAVLTPEKMTQLHEVLNDGHRLDEMIAHDMALAADDHIDQTPTVILTANGKRRKVTGVISFPVLEDAIENLLAQQQ